MKKMKKMVAAITAAALLSSSSLMAQDEGPGVAYYDSYGMTSFGPGLAVGIIAVAAVVAVLVNNKNEGTVHTHVHCTPSS